MTQFIRCNLLFVFPDNSNDRIIFSSYEKRFARRMKNVMFWLFPLTQGYVKIVPEQLKINYDN